MFFVASRAGIVGREEAGRAVAIVQLAKIRRARENVVVRIKGISAKAVARPQVGPRLRHDLHQPHRPLGRHGAHVTATFRLHDGLDPRRRNAETPRGLRDETLDPITLRCHGRLRGRYGLRVGDAARGEQHHHDRDTQMAAKAACAM